ncbi:ATP-binding cassette domain-containing protein [Mycoplasma hafezii]|uniref:ATP-binding cassette domain-containing protein n=1 Tax=Mycoplasma hafezii TaxID=525886 RepID=UPI003CEC5DEE
MQIKINNISHIFNKNTPWEFQALNNVSLEINQGEYIGVIGSTGSGKTTLIEHLNNLLEPTSGYIDWTFVDEKALDNKRALSKIENTKRKALKKLGKQLDKALNKALKIYKSNYKKEHNQKLTKSDWLLLKEKFSQDYLKNSPIIHKIYQLKSYQEGEANFTTGKTAWKSFISKKKFKRIRSKVGVAFQFAEYQLFKGTIQEDIAFGPIAFGMNKEQAYEKARECLLQVGMPEEYLERSPFELSGGQKRRVALAGILAMEPDYLVVDEPTAGLDPKGVVEILDILSDLNKQGKTIINVSHDLDNILERANRVLLLKEGQLIADDTPYAVLNNVKLLRDNNLQPPQLLDFVDELREIGIDVPEVHSLEELAEFLNTRKESNE